MTIDLSDPEAMLAHAKRHYSLLNECVTAWIAADYAAIETYRNENDTEFGAYLVLSKEPDLERYGLIVNDCIHNLRCTLDHLVFALAVAHIPNLSPDVIKKLQFPIADNVAAFNLALKRNKLDLFSNGIQTVFRECQPFNRVHPTHVPLLSILRDLSNEGKHRVLVPTLTVPGNILFYAHGIEETNPAKVTPSTVLKHRQIFLNFVFKAPNTKFYLDVQLDYLFTFARRFVRAEQTPRTSIVQLAAMLIEEVEEIIRMFSQPS